MGSSSDRLVSRDDKWFSLAEISSGGTRNGLYKPKEYHGRGAKIVNMGELFAFPRLRNEKMKRIEVSPYEHDRFGLREGDLLFARRSLVADGAGKCSIVMQCDEPTVFESSIIRLRPSRDQVEPEYLYYLFRSIIGDQILDTIRKRDAVSGITGKDLANLKVPIPDIEIQKRISKSLRTLDDRIDHNRALAANLEAIARALFKSWFVDFDPVRAKAAGEAPKGFAPDLAALFPDRFVDSELGEIPEGWACSPITKIAAVHSGGTPKRAVDEYWCGTIPWYSVVDAPRMGEVFVIETSEHITEAGLANSAAKTLPHGVTIISARGTVGKLALTCGPMTINQSCYALKGTLGDFFTYFTVAASIDWLKQNVHGAVFDTITRATLDGLLVIHPSDQAARAFDDTVCPIMLRIEACSREASAIAKLRNLLLPRLISGKLRVEDAEAALEAA